MKRVTYMWKVAAALAATTALMGQPLSGAEEKEPFRLDGTWKWNFTMSDGSRIEPRAKLKREGGALTGTSISRPSYDAPITNGVIQGDSVSWFVVREQDGRKVTTRYQGRIKGDTIKGTIESDWKGEKRSYEWEAKHVPQTIEGTWRWDVSFGELRFESRLKLKRDGEKLTGKLAGGRGREIDISAGKFKAGDVSFEVVRERDGEKFVTSYTGKLDGDTIKGESEYYDFFVGEKRKRDWIATRVEE